MRGGGTRTKEEVLFVPIIFPFLSPQKGPFGSKEEEEEWEVKKQVVSPRAF